MNPPGIDHREATERVAITLKRIESGRIIAIVRGDFGAFDEVLTATLAEEGIGALELTVDSPDAFARIDRLCRAFGDRMAIGAGTVLSPSHVESAAQAGASFIVAPNCDPEVIRAAVSRGLVVIPGCLTPSEMVLASRAGAQVLKLFPAQAIPPDAMRALRGPLPQLRLVPTGGITPAHARAYRDAGAWALGVGSELVGRSTAGWDADALRARARSFVEAAQ